MRAANRSASARRGTRRATRAGITLIATLWGLRALAAPPVALVRIPASDRQLGGPAHDFRISRTEIRNDQFVDFLNDALAHRATPRAAWMYFDIDSGGVYIHTAETGVTGTDGSGTLLFDASVNGAVTYADGVYVVADTDRSGHPVTGVTWYGAVKYCNWLTIASGMPAGERAYNEASATNLFGWKPVTISAGDWSTRDLLATERDALLGTSGFRLPMDGGVDGTHVHGEWYKAAVARRGLDETVAFDALYGFGRSALSGADANYADSGDPFEPGATPVGFFDGRHLLGDGVTPTSDTQNAYGMYDLAGNVWEWMQDQGPGGPSQRRNRGGSWRSQPSSLAAVVGAQRGAASVSDATGFRVVQVAADDLLVTPFDDQPITGPWGGPYGEPGSDRVTYRLTNTISAPLDYTIDIDAVWLTAEPVAGTIPIDDSAEVVVTVAPICFDALSVGAHSATVRVRTGTDAATIDRTVRLTVIEPLAVSTPTPSSIEMTYGGSPSPAEFSFTLDSTSDATVDWSATWADASDSPSEAAWLTLDGAAEAGGSIAPNGSIEVLASLNPSAVAALDAGTHTARVTFIDECTGTSFTRNVSLVVLPPLTVAPAGGDSWRGLAGGPFDPVDHTFTLTNRLETELTWAVRFCAEEPGDAACTPPDPTWLGADPAGSTIAPHENANVTLSILEAAAALPPATYAITARFVEAATGFAVDRVVKLEVEGLRVAPDGAATFTGPLAGPFSPEGFAFTLHNNDAGDMDWTVVAEFDSLSDGTDAPAWFAVEPGAGAILEPDGTAEIVVRVTGDALSLPSGRFGGAITFTANGVSTRRDVELFVGGEAFALAMANVPAEDVQTAGPAHHFRIATYEVRNSEFARFLNDAYRHRGERRAGFMYHDTDSGGVYLHAGPEGAKGTDAPSASLSTPLYLASAGRIRFDQTAPEPYVVEEGFYEHPVSGVSWYGAVKFCNWMTLIQNMPADARVYLEGPDVSDWRPAASDASALLALPGFRLPTDGGAGPAAPYNEWNKSASRKGTDANGVALFGAIYAFGRDVIGDADANFRDSGDTVSQGTTPVGFFDGVNQLLDEATTRGTGNGYRLFDMTGNVAEWVHELDLSGPAPRGAARGGHFNHERTFAQLRNDVRDLLPADSAFTFVGFRVAQSLTPTPLMITHDDDRMQAEGPVGGPFGAERFVVQLTHHGDYTVDDVSVSVSSAEGWLVFDGAPPRQVPPMAVTGLPIEVPLRLSDAAADLSVSPTPSGGMRLVSPRTSGGGDANGPAYGYWLGAAEVTNAAFVSFLNSARANAVGDAPDPLSDYMYFDVDSGDVYINDERTGGEGVDAPSDTITTLLYDASIGRITYDSEQYVVAAGYENHPVVGVTWFGALKYCNWFTIAAGLPVELRAYVEAVDPALWRPATISAEEWAVRDLSDAERNALALRFIGYRLPMDDGSNNADPASDAADAFNEWLSAAAFHISDAGGAFDAVYGFGRDALTFADGNFLSSGDTAEDGTTPVAFFNGGTTLFGAATRTSASANGFGLYDLCGNVAEWTQDRYSAANPDQRAIRGGGWRDAIDAPALRNDRRVALSPDARNDHTGFRVVRGVGHVGTVRIADGVADTVASRHVLLDLREPLELSPLGGITLAGPYCTRFAGETRTYALRSESDADMPWRIDISPDANWIDLEGPVAGERAGTIEGGDDRPVRVSVATNDHADALPPGTHRATVSVVNTRTERSATRDVRITIEAPIAVSADGSNARPEFEGPWEGPFEDRPPLRYALGRCDECDSDCPLDYRVRATVPWLTIEPAESLTGALPPGPESIEFDVSLNETANTLPVGNYTGAASFNFIDPSSELTGQAIERTIKLVVRDPIVIDQDRQPWDICCELSESALPSQDYRLTNTHRSNDIGVTVSVDVDWLDVDPAVIAVLPGETEIVTVSLTADALRPHGTYPATITFHDTATDHDQTREVLLRITENLSVTPLGGFATAGPTTGWVDPSATRYTLTNIAGQGATVIDWTAHADQPWVRLSGAAAAGGSIADGETTHVIVQVLDELLQPIPAGETEAEALAVVTFEDRSNGEMTARTVWVRRTNPRFDLDLASVSDRARQPAGPAYPFQIGRFHVTNAAFVAFLNDARNHPGDERGAHMYFDTTTGDVYVNTSTTGESGEGAAGRATLMFAPGATDGIEFVDGAYRVAAAPNDMGSHPVTNVSWFGAVKHCNWLTLDQGMLPGDRCYVEAAAPDATGWRPASISATDWSTRDLNDAERRALVTDFRGFRLPMDDGYGNATPSADAADAYNEWYKAAAWNEALRRNTVYGFGRDPLADGDANFRCSGDPFEDVADCERGGSTPVGFYDGAAKTTPAGSLMTRATDNSFGLHDMTGNVHQWLQGRYAPPASFARRTLRGGSWNDAAASDALRAARRPLYAPPSTTSDQIGFRVVRSLGARSADADLDGDVDLVDLAAAAACLGGPSGGVRSGCSMFDLDADGDVDLLDIEAMSRSFTHTN